MIGKKLDPYVGVTGFMSRSEVEQALDMLPPGAKRSLMVGVLMSSKTLAGQTNKWAGRYPSKEAVANIFVDDPRALNLVHYHTDTPEHLCAELSEIVKLAGSKLDGFQLNVAWPPPPQIEFFRRIFPHLYLVLQIGGRAMAKMSSMTHFQVMIDCYLDHIDAVLIDPSGGKGEPFDPKVGAEYLRAMPRRWQMGIGIAGGLASTTLYLLDDLVQEFPDLSIDAEGRLRTPQPEDRLDLNETRQYIAGAYRKLEGEEHAARNSAV